MFKRAWQCFRLHFLPVTKFDLIQTERHIMAKVSSLGPALDEISTGLTAVSDQLAKATSEIITAIADAELPAEVTLKLEGLKGLATTLKEAAQKLDDLNPDAEPPPPPTP